MNMNLNRKGYLAVEVILASVVAITIAIFLMEITVKLVNVTDDAYVDTELLTDKTLIIKNIKNQLEEDIKNNCGIKSISEISSSIVSGYKIDFYKEDAADNYYDRKIYVLDNQVIYDEDSDDVTEFYHKNLNKKYLSNFSITTSKTGTINNNEYILFKIEADSKFSKEPFIANIIVQNNKTC